MFVEAAAAYIVDVNKDFDANEIHELVVSRINRSDFAQLVELLEPHVSGNEMNAPRYAINLIAQLQA